LRVKGRELELSGLALPMTFVAFAGPAPGPPLTAEALAAVRASNPAWVLVLGGLGDTEKDAVATLKALSTLSMPVLLLQGGRDRPVRVAAALEAVHGDHLVDISALRRVRLGKDSFAIVPGAARGGYAADPDACGHTLDDLKALSQQLGTRPSGERRFLWAWHAPGGGGAFAVGRDARGVSAGDLDLAELSTRIGTPGGLFAWPHVRAAAPSIQRGKARAGLGQASAELALVVPRLGGPPLQRSDGGQVPSSAALLTLDAAGLRLDSLLPEP
jgi:hypothetical protein